MVHDVWLFLIRPLLPDGESIWSHSSSTLGVGASAGDLAHFFAYPYLARALFLMKLPYLVADLATGYLLTRLVAPERRRRVLALWLLNPLVIFCSVIFARHDSMSIFLVVLSVLVARSGRRYLGLVLLGLGALARFFPVFLAPFFILAYRRSRRELLILGGGLMGLLALVEGTTWAVTGSSPALTLLTRYSHVGYLVEVSFPLWEDARLFIFPLAYLLLVLRHRRLPRGRSGSHAALVRADLLSPAIYRLAGTLPGADDRPEGGADRLPPGSDRAARPLHAQLGSGNDLEPAPAARCSGTCRPAGPDDDHRRPDLSRSVPRRGSEPLRSRNPLDGLPYPA
jgi:hypothetical protein